MHTGTGEIIDQEELRKRFEERPQDVDLYVPATFATPEQIRRGRVGRNEPCPCGSGLKFKRCCWTPQSIKLQNTPAALLAMPRM